MNLVDHFFGRSGSINRRTYAVSLLGLFWSVSALAAVLPPAGLLFFPSLYAMACLTVKRLHDIGLSGKWALLPLFAVFTYIAALLLSGVIAFGAGVTDAGSHAEQWASAVGAALAIGVFLSWAALIVVPGNAHSRTKFGRPSPPLVAPPVPDLKALTTSVRKAAPEVGKSILGAVGTGLAVLSAFARVNYLKLFFVASGRISRGAYIASFVLLFFASMMLIVSFASLPALNWITIILFSCCLICLASKRLHDFGASGWFAVAPFIILYVYGILVFCMYLANLGFFGAELRRDPVFQMLHGSSDDTTEMIFLGSLLAYGVLGLIPGQNGPNEHGEALSMQVPEDPQAAMPA